MSKLTRPKTREIIDDFAKEIAKTKRQGRPPTKAVIDFRDERGHGIERDIHYVPIGLLRYRKDNGRISSDVLNYERGRGILDETSEETQQKIRGFLEEKDKEKTEELKRSIKHEGQREPAIITCDGFLINGNRRKMVTEMLAQENPGDERFKSMKVVILPGRNDEGGPPTLREIEEIENRYQLQSEGKAEYYAFDRALSMRRKMELGMSLEEQLRDDPIYAGLADKEFNKAVQKFKNEFLYPLDCVDRYLSNLEREGLYGTISRGLGDPEGRWQAFLDYYKSIYSQLADQRKRIKLGIEENDVGKIEDVAFKIIRLRRIQGLPGITKVHEVMRQMPKWLKKQDSKKELLKLGTIELGSPREDTFDEKGTPYSLRTIDTMWGQKHAATINRQLKKAVDQFEYKKEQETPMNLLEAALKKLNHEDMRADSVRISELPKVMKLAEQIKTRAKEIGREFYRYKKDHDKFKQKHRK
ncbi:MAG: hypothetical protein ISS70_00485 [Phycisphaerae bacterium]|nr:hypothetical protein [Phycisphaerae bacterium]